MDKIVSQLGLRPAAKAYVSGGVTAASWALARYAGIGDEPESVQIISALQMVLEATVAYIIGFASTWLARNRP